MKEKSLMTEKQCLFCLQNYTQRLLFLCMILTFGTDMYYRLSVLTSFSLRKARIGATLDFLPSIVVYQLKINEKSLINKTQLTRQR